MDRNIPHVLDIFVSSPGERRRILAKQREEEKFATRQLKDQQKNPGSDSAVCLCSSSDEDERNISKYFDYLNEDDEDSSSPKKKKSSKNVTDKKCSTEVSSQVHKQRKSPEENSKPELEKDIKQIERHLSMKKTIRKKMMRDLQQAFVEDPKEFEQDPSCIPPERKNNINIQNLTISKKRMSKSEHSFLDMLKENEQKDKAYVRTTADKSQAQSSKNHKRSSAASSSRKNHNESDSGNDSPTRNGNSPNYPPNTQKGNQPPPSKRRKKGNILAKAYWQGENQKIKSFHDDILNSAYTVAIFTA